MTDCLYAQWLSKVVDLSDAKCVEMLDFMSSFCSLAYKNSGITMKYARCWCILSRFLYAHREQQLYSDKVQMTFLVPERKQQTDVYWFEVARSCDLLAQETMLNLVQDLSIMRAMAQNQGYAETAINLSDDTLATAMSGIKSAIGICHYSLKVAALHCKVLTPSAPQLMADINLRYHSFRVMGCFVQGVYKLKQKEAQEAANWLATAKMIGEKEEVTPAVAPLLHTIKLLVKYAFAHKALREGQRGVAIAHTRSAERCKGANIAFVERLNAETALPPGATAPPIPDAKGPLLQINCFPHDGALELGTSPFTKADPELKIAQ